MGIIPFANATVLLAVVAIGAVMWAIVWLIMEARYKGKNEGLEQQNEVLKERIALRDEQYADLQKKSAGPVRVAVTATNAAIAFRDREIP